ncbi:uncharacterized protein LOC113830899 isoform X2 [Cricetulus griseus]|uniref:Uncharacterized protein LOC113830899 isoform X2 n=1 Tax=Cricetulus griseus TaxID=10029 RepID=A0A9J7JCI5_CRIGR|nr:uncharacterized protein LOC113830899 isoform X2 [Cricetulus griseus]
MYLSQPPVTTQAVLLKLPASALNYLTLHSRIPQFSQGPPMTLSRLQFLFASLLLQCFMMSPKLQEMGAAGRRCTPKDLPPVTYFLKSAFPKTSMLVLFKKGMALETIILPSLAATVNVTNIYQEQFVCQAVCLFPSFLWKQSWRVKVLEGWVWATHPASDLENEPRDHWERSHSSSLLNAQQSSLRISQQPRSRGRKIVSSIQGKICLPADIRVTYFLQLGPTSFLSPPPARHPSRD